VTLPLLDWDRIGPDRLCEALSDFGCFRLRHPALPGERLAGALDDARAFFMLPPEIKSGVAIEHSPHFRGYSEMKNERDWREQLHLGAEVSHEEVGPPFLRLEGPNLWPPDPVWRQRMLSYLAAAERIGKEVLAGISGCLGTEPASFADGPGLAPYLVMKLICYHPQPDPDAPRPGVAAHVDFSWLTFTLQDDTGGLEIRTPDGRWISVEPVPGTLLVHAGEILAFATRGRIAATPHRVINRRSDRPRLSIPVFLNPSLRTVVTPLPGTANSHVQSPAVDDDHVHRVLSPAEPGAPFHFGEAEWRRKGLNVWCTECASLAAAGPRR
jgi:isopenicillin N synthase-like dioxygenase